jgi:hypothetical protein
MASLASILFFIKQECSYKLQLQVTFGVKQKCSVSEFRKADRGDGFGNVYFGLSLYVTELSWKD